MIVAVDGRTAYAYTGGKAFDPALPVVALVHGALNDHSVWTLTARWLAHHGYAVLAVDLPGHGRSAGPPLASIEAIADWLLSLLDVVDAASASLVGHSMGSLVALEAAAGAPARARHLVMVCTAYPMSVSPALLEAAEREPRRAIANVSLYSHSSHAAKPSYPGPGAWLHGASVALMQRLQDADPSVNLFLNDFRVCDRYRAGKEAAAKVTCPATLVLGRRDQMTMPGNAGALAEALGTMPVLLDGGHALMTEVPDALLAVLRNALAG